MAAEPFDAFVLTGGKSERMGRDKALLTIGGVAMAARVAAALAGAGATQVVCVGGDVAALRALGLDAIPDGREGSGPLGGLLSALEHGHEPVVVVTPCDLLDPAAAVFEVLVAGVAGATAAVPIVDGLWRPLPCAIRRSATGALAEAFEAGERSVHRAMATLTRREVDAGPLPDADTPGDLRGRR